MGTWGAGSFENDDALDWLDELLETNDASLIEETLKFVLDQGDEYLEAPEASRAVAAVQIIAAANNAACPDLPEDAKLWIRLHPIKSKSVIQLASRVLHRIKTSSELKELWEESDYFLEWTKVINDLEMRLKV
jgi:hypothetical protein